MHWLLLNHWFWTAFWWAVAIYFIVAGVMFVTDVFRNRLTAQESAEAILRRRYAAGEIDIEEFQRRLTVLRVTRKAA